jgi:hypothetical protein
MNLCRELRCPCWPPPGWMSNEDLARTLLLDPSSMEMFETSPPVQSANCILKNMTMGEVAMLRWVTQQHWVAREAEAAKKESRKEDREEMAESAKKKRVD